MDDGTRALPSGFPGTETITSLANSANTEILDYSLMLPNDWAFESRKSVWVDSMDKLREDLKNAPVKRASFSLVGGATYNSSKSYPISPAMILLLMEHLNTSI